MKKNRILSSLLALSLVASLQLGVVPVAIADESSESAPAVLTTGENTNAEEAIYINPETGTAVGSGSAESPVATFEQALALQSANPAIKTIYVAKAIKVLDDATFTLPEGVVLKRAPGFTSDELIYVASGASLTLKDIVVDGDETQSPYDSLVYVDGKLTVTGATELRNNKNRYYGGAVYVGDKGTFVLEEGTIANNAGASGGGVYVKGVMEMHGGTIDGNKATSKDLGDGGGVHVAYGGTFNFYDGTISNNRAEMAGGGISVGGQRDYHQKSKLYMYGGTVDANSAERAGGGIFIQAGSYGYVEAGYITNNRGHDSNIWYQGWYTGAGLYVNGGYSGAPWNIPDGQLDINRAYVVNNRSYEQGGGIANCPSSTLSIYLSNGLAVGQNYQVGYLRWAHIDDDFWITSNNAGSNGVVDHSGTPTMFVSSVMLGGAKNNWVYYGNGGVPFEYLDEEYTMPEDTDIQLVNNISDEDLERAAAKATVFITGNYAVWGKGGGVGSNGILNFGVEYPEYGSLTVSKTVEGGIADAEQEFNFRVTLDYQVTGTYGEMDFVDGVAEFALKNGEAKTATDLIPDFSYTVEEIVVPGYTASYPNGNSGQIVGNEESAIAVVNKLIEREVLISKVELGQGEELEGAALSLTGTDMNGNEIEKVEWVSGGQPKAFSLPAGTYTLVEDQAPLGYEVAEAITFKVEIAEDGTLVVTIDGQEVADAKVVMEDKPEEVIEPPTEPETPLGPPPTEPEEPTVPEEPITSEQPTTPAAPPTVIKDNPTPTTPARSTVSGPVRTADAFGGAALGGLLAFVIAGGVGLVASRRKVRD